MATLYGLSNCVSNSYFCNVKICSVKEFQYKTKESCKDTWCKADANVCTWDICQDGNNKWYIDGCKSSYKEKHPSAIQFLNPDDIAACKADADSCNKNICDNALFS